MTTPIAVIDAGYPDYDQERAILAEAGCSLAVFEGGRHDRAGKLACARGARGLFIRWTVFDDAAFAALPDLRWLVRYGVGYDNIDLAAAGERGVKVCNVQGYASHSVSDHALALMLACLRGLRSGERRLRSHFGAPPREAMAELRELTVGLVGLGRIGGAFARKVAPLVRRVLASDPYVPAERFAACGAESVPLGRVLQESDVVSLHCNLTEETTRLIDTGAIAAMRSGAILINTARGPVVDEAALARAVAADRIMAGLDVFEDEPPAPERDALLASPHVVATGHYAWHSSAAARDLQRRAALNMAAMVRGETPEDCLNPDAFA
jgi:D-3-phosphoglycerate dehydrogenase